MWEMISDQLDVILGRESGSRAPKDHAKSIEEELWIRTEIRGEWFLGFLMFLLCRTDMCVVSAGDRIGVAEIGLMASVGVVKLECFKRPIVAVLSNGDEIVDASEATVPFGKVRDSNRPMLLAAVSDAGCRPLDLGIAGDSEGSLRTKFMRALDEGADVIITSGRYCSPVV